MPDDHLWTCVLISVLLTLISMLLSFSYHAVENGIESRLRKDADDGDKRALSLLDAMESSSRISRDGMFAICFLSLASAMIFSGAVWKKIVGLIPVFESAFISHAVVIAAFIVFAALIMLVLYIFVISIPRGASEHSPARAYSATSWISRPVFAIFRPAASVGAYISGCILRIFSIKSSDDENVTEDEIIDIVDASEESGNIEAAEKEMIKNVIDFSDIFASDVMTHRTDMEAIDILDDDEEIYALIEESGFSRFPVYEDDIDHIIGILYTREYLLSRSSGVKKPLRELIHKPLSVPEKVRADVLFREMQKSKIHMAVIVDEYGGTSGIVTMEDLLEEIFGNIYDEFDEREPQDIQKLDDNLWRVAGSVDLETLSEELGIKFDADVLEDYDTLGGLVFSSLSVIPGDGEKPHVSAFGLDIQVEVFADRRVEWATVSVLPEEENEEE